jgi:hypothetical protein
MALGDTSAPRQNVAIWLSNIGPVVFAGGPIQPLADYNVKRYFTPGDDLCVSAAYLDRASGCYDPNYNEYHLLIPSGATATDNNVRLTFDLANQKWRENTPTIDFPQYFFRVTDTIGNTYLYALTATGHVLRCDNGRVWSTSDYPMTYTVRTGDMLPTGSLWDETLIHSLQVTVEPNAEGYLAVNHYLDGSDTRTETLGTAALGLPPEATPRSLSHTGYRWRNFIFQCAASTGGETPIYSGLSGGSHAFEFVVTGCSVTKPRLAGWGVQWMPVREETLDRSGN